MLNLVRTRFPPSPTGWLHIGGLRTALYNWLFARKNQGLFILRIEDTDRERSTPQAVTTILDALKWCGLDYDAGPYFQTQRFDRYRQVLSDLLRANKAYRCDCSPERLDALRATQIAQKQKPRYDGFCRERVITAQHRHVVRFRNPDSGSVVFDDKTYGRIIVDNDQLDDLVLARSDGTPTYNFTVVVDDWDMQITHVIRGDDHLSNTPRQINLLNALGATVPVYAHVPMILDPAGKKLSKRSGAANVLDYEAQGYLPDAVLNYLLRLGWSRGDQEIFSRTQMIDCFDLDVLHKAPAALNPEKLLWLNQYYLKNTDPHTIAGFLEKVFQKHAVDLHSGPTLVDLIVAQRDRVKTLNELAEKSLYFYSEVEVDYGKISSDLFPALQQLLVCFEQLDPWEAASIHQILLDVTTKLTIKFAALAQQVRRIMTGGNVSPPIDVTLFLLGKQRVVDRLRIACSNEH